MQGFVLAQVLVWCRRRNNDPRAADERNNEFFTGRRGENRLLVEAGNEIFVQRQFVNVVIAQGEARERAVRE